MNCILTSELARELLGQIIAAGWHVDLTDLAPRRAKPWNELNDTPGVELSAVSTSRPNERVTAVQVRDWSRTRAEIEAVCLLARHLGVPLHAEPDTEDASLAIAA